MTAKSQKHWFGFTLIELLIVIAVLGVLATIVLIAVNPQTQFARARDAERKTAVNQIAKALDRFYVLHGYYPNPCDRTDSQGGCASATNWRQAEVLLAAGELDDFPVDPINDGFIDVWNSSRYSYFIISENGPGGGSAGDYYLVGAFLEDRGDPQTLGNLPNRPYWPDCAGQIGFSPHLFIIKSYKCPGDPEY